MDKASRAAPQESNSRTDDYFGDVSAFTTKNRLLLKHLNLPQLNTLTALKVVNVGQDRPHKERPHNLRQAYGSVTVRWPVPERVRKGHVEGLVDERPGGPIVKEVAVLDQEL